MQYSFIVPAERGQR